MTDDDSAGCVPAQAPAARTGRWAPGTPILWRYRQNAGTAIHLCRPVTVVQDSEDLLAVWMAGGTECIRPAMEDGSPVAAEPLGTRYTKPHVPVRVPWRGHGILKLAVPGEPWSVWLFWDHGWRFRSWYVNLEEPLERRPAGVDSEDHFLDISVDPDGSWHWRDEDEFVEAQRAGLLGAAQAERVRAAGLRAVARIESWGSPFRDPWPDWRPDPAWTIPSLPDNWDRTPAHVS